MKINKVYKSLLAGAFLSILSVTGVQSQEQDSLKIWKTGASLGFNFSNVGLSHWAAGGTNSMAFGSVFSATADRETEKSVWKNKLDLAYGVLRQGDKREPFRKTDDKISFNSQYGYKLNNEWSVSASTDFRTQFTHGYSFTADAVDPTKEVQTRISSFMAPGYLTNNLGFLYKKKWYSLTMSPVAFKTTFVLDDQLSAAGAFGVDEGKKVRNEFGAYFIADLQKKIMKNAEFKSSLKVFANYERLKHMDVDWETLLVLQVNKYISTTFATHLIYDDDIDIKRDNGTVGPITQFKHVLNIGVIFNL